MSGSKVFEIKSFSASTTRQLGKFLAHLLANASFSGKRSLVVFLKGDLGSGKTTFVLGFLRFFGIKPLAASPTFVLLKHYSLKRKKNFPFSDIYHLDAYRLSSAKDLKLLGFEKIINSPSLIFIEWPENLKGLKVKEKIVIEFKYGSKENERIISFS